MSGWSCASLHVSVLGRSEKGQIEPSPRCWPTSQLRRKPTFRRGDLAAEFGPIADTQHSFAAGAALHAPEAVAAEELAAAWTGSVSIAGSVRPGHLPTRTVTGPAVAVERDFTRIRLTLVVRTKEGSCPSGGLSYGTKGGYSHGKELIRADRLDLGEGNMPYIDGLSECVGPVLR